MSQSPDPQLIDRMLGSMEQWSASDLFVTGGKPPAIRVHGVVQRLKAEPSDGNSVIAWMEHALPDRAAEKFRETGDIDVGYSLPDGRRFRLNFSMQRGEVTLVARALPSGELRFEDLGLPTAVRKLAEEPRGLVLVTGATGSGKSTTLAAMIHHVNVTRKAHIITVEDPIEFFHKDIRGRITQREMGIDSEGFDAALRHILRQSPDVIMIGEMRDADTVTTAMSAAMTGHLVLATLHTIDASQTLQRILGFYPEDVRAQVALDASLALKGVVSQRLVPRQDGSGRVVATEVLTMTPAASLLVREQRVDELQDLMRNANTKSIVTFNQSLLALYRQDVISFETGKAYATNPDEFALYAGGMRESVGREGAANETSASEIGLDVKKLLSHALKEGASDLHLAVGRPAILRISGSLIPINSSVLTAANLRTLLYSIMSQRQRSVYELEREIDFAIALETGQRFRVNAYYQKGQMAAAMRAIPSNIPDAKDMRIPESIMGLADKPHGLLLVVGPTGSGKSTTMACLIDRINHTRACRIITVEDPIEYTHTSVNSTIDQREVLADTKSFAQALKYILRQDPDVILVGEMRDHETVSAALAAAETGHLVLATLHTNDAVQTIDRIVDVFPPHQQEQARSQIASALVGVVSQRLLRRKDGKGRLPVFEIMVATPAIRAVIRENKMHQAEGLMEASKKDGMNTLDSALKKLLADGDISVDEAQRYMKTVSVMGSSGVQAGAPAPGPAPRK